jgi:hypothetical protein
VVLLNNFNRASGEAVYQEITRGGSAGDAIEYTGTYEFVGYSEMRSTRGPVLYPVSGLILPSGSSMFKQAVQVTRGSDSRNIATPLTALVPSTWDALSGDLTVEGFFIFDDTLYSKKIVGSGILPLMTLVNPTGETVWCLGVKIDQYTTSAEQHTRASAIFIRGGRNAAYSGYPANAVQSAESGKLYSPSTRYAHIAGQVRWVASAPQVSVWLDGVGFFASPIIVGSAVPWLDGAKLVIGGAFNPIGGFKALPPDTRVAFPFYIDEARVTVGVARYTANPIPPTSRTPPWPTS